MAGKSTTTRWQGEITLVIATVLLFASVAAAAKATVVNPFGSPVVSKVRPEFISFGIDASQLTQRNSGQPFDFTRPALRNLAAELAPAFIRYSGTKVESTFYDDTNTLPANGAPDAYRDLYENKGVMNRAEWVAALKFADDAGLEVIASTSAGPGPRNPDGTWDPTNARSLFQRAIAEGYPPKVVMFGNEPNITFYGSGISANYTAADYARDLDDFLELKRELLPGSTFVGPGPFLSTGSENPLNGVPLGPEIKDIMALTGSRYDVVSYHQYPAFGESEKCAALLPKVPTDTLAPSFLDTPIGAYKYMAGLRDKHSPGKPLWIDESGNTACGGVDGYSDKFISTFYYLNSLGYLAQKGVEVVTRWTLSGPQPYALIKDDTLEPRPDYWAAVLWRRLMGPIVLKPTVHQPDPEVRTYTQCRPGHDGEATTLLLNTSRTATKTVEFRDLNIQHARQFLVTGALDDDKVNLNGVRLEAASDGTLPAMPGVPLKDGAVSLPPAAYAFVTIPSAGVQDCGMTVIVDTGSNARIKAPKQSLRKILKTGKIKATCRPSMPSICSASAVIPRHQARRIGLPLGSRPGQVTIATARKKFTSTKRRSIVLKIQKPALRKLRRAPAKFRPQITLEAQALASGVAFVMKGKFRLRLRR